MKGIKIILWLVLLCGTIFVSSCGKPSSGPAGYVQKAVGQAVIVRDQKTIPAGQGDRLLQGDVIRTMKDGVIVIFLNNGLEKIEIQQDSEFSLADTSSHMRLKLLKGNAWTFVEKLRKGSTFSLDGPSAVVGVRGTKFFMFDAGNGMQGICHCEGDSDFTDKNDNKSSMHREDSLVFMKGGKTVILTPGELNALKFVHHHSAIADSAVGPKNDIPYDVKQKVAALAKKKLAEAE